MDQAQSRVELGDALMALRDAFVRAMWDGQRSRVRFRLEPVELTIQVTASGSASGTAGVKWYVFNVGGEKKRNSESIQTLTVRLTPVLFDAGGNELPAAEQLIGDPAGSAVNSPTDTPVPDRR